MSRFLSHDKTKSDLTEYLAAKTLENNKGSSKLIITSASELTKRNKDLVVEENNHEEADTLLIHQAGLASQRNPHDCFFVVLRVWLTWSAVASLYFFPRALYRCISVSPINI
ncbi:unnamed protein product [Leuciscus chuanchicus]